MGKAGPVCLQRRALALVLALVVLAGQGRSSLPRTLTAAHLPPRPTRRHRPRRARLVALFLAGAHPGLLLVDHVHFQYNGVLLGGWVRYHGLLPRG